MYKDPLIMATLLAGDTNITITGAVVSAVLLDDRCGDSVISMLESTASARPRAPMQIDLDRQIMRI